ncbi:murein L,D-transpeptidase catalytic domain family protein [Fusobacterium perfoetens]|uniref:murein L,D-transpeptidase catalytic domain family protein n=1 Tax=Fusobacterium perfoetens TaxID=852 RepID=UPI001F1B5190|nr:murein L,D-transpeptidase catalytic domain family protein [Fusobacterium perfoetens]MCF2626392.1 murein L,D-transpeptidase catalytic domain family protein [Fusobacterium perfoetens]
MKKILLTFFSILTFTLSYGDEISFQNIINPEKVFINTIPQNKGTYVDESQYLFLYNNFNLKDKLSYRIFKMALKGYSKIPERKTKYLVIADYSKPSYEKRFFVLNMENFTLEDYTYVAHGKNSGADTAVSFSNKMNSYKSSVGFYLTGKPYNGRYGYSLKLFGLEDGYNSNAFKRGVVIHGASASEPEYINKFGFLGRTEGCPAVPKSLNKKIIEKIKNGSVLFIYGNDTKYLRDSKYIK